MQNAWDPLRYLESEPTARKFLTEAYQRNGVERPERYAFQLSSRFLYTCKQARHYYEAAARVDLMIRPLLLFYGCMNLLKGVLLVNNPLYPQNSRMLQHGVTTRKIKKTPFHLLEDEARPQKEGLFAEAAKAFGLAPLQERYTMKQLFSCLPELSVDYAKVVEKGYWVPLQHKSHRQTLIFPHCTEGVLAYSTDTFLHYLNRLAPDGMQFAPGEPLSPVEQRGNRSIVYRLENNQSIERHPLFALTSSEMRFWNHPDDVPPTPAWASHYLLLYLLGMLCRYETESWGELVLSHSYAELYLVERFLDVHQALYPTIIFQAMQNNNT